MTQNKLLDMINSDVNLYNISFNQAMLKHIKETERLQNRDSVMKYLINLYIQQYKIEEK